MHWFPAARSLAFVALVASLAAAEEAEDAGVITPSFAEGDIITFDQIDRLKPFIPEQFWDNRDLFFYESMSLEIGPTQFDYAPTAQYHEATERSRANSDAEAMAVVRNTV